MLNKLHEQIASNLTGTFVRTIRAIGIPTEGGQAHLWPATYGDDIWSCEDKKTLRPQHCRYPCKCCICQPSACDSRKEGLKLYQHHPTLWSYLSAIFSTPTMAFISGWIMKGWRVNSVAISCTGISKGIEKRVPESLFTSALNSTRLVSAGSWKSTAQRSWTFERCRYQQFRGSWGSDCP